MNKIKFMIKELLDVNRYSYSIPEDNNEQREMLKVLMTVSRPEKLSEQYYEYEAEYLRKEQESKTIMNIEYIKEKLTDNIYIYDGDITKIKADAIVNAANEKLLGCFIPGHHCIDNAIHLSAGLGLRNACNDIMVAQKSDEEVGKAKVTSGFNLPSKYVVHTVGPNLNSRKEVDINVAKAKLKSCYESCLKAINKYEDIRNIVFCSISTGVYGFPIEIASKVAIDTIEEYLKNNKHHLDKVVINVFGKEDYDVYKRHSN